MLTRSQYRLLNLASWFLGIAFVAGLSFGVDRLHLPHWLTSVAGWVIVALALTIFGTSGSYGAYRRASGDPTAPSPPRPRPIGMTKRVLGFIVGAFAVGMFGLIVWLAVADGSWGLVLPMSGAAVFGVAFLYVAFTGRDPIGRLAAGDRTTTPPNMSSDSTGRPNER